MDTKKATILQQDAANRQVFLTALKSDTNSEILKKLSASFMDITLLKQNVTSVEIDHLCQLAMQISARAVCIPPYFCKKASEWLKGSSVRLATVISFPMGYNSLELKQAEIDQALKAGVQELDIVHTLCLATDSDGTSRLQGEYQTYRDVAGESAILKVILETSLLSPKQIEQATRSAYRAQLDIVKTSTGFGSRGASCEDIETMHQAILKEGGSLATMGIKASGGIKTWEQMVALIQAGATRIGASAVTEIFQTLNH